MKVVVRQNLCVGHGLCESIAAAVFTVGDDAISRVLVDEIPDEQREMTEQAIAACPANALRRTE